jgi:hypothetical protein
MAHPKAMGIVAMLVLLALIVALLPSIVRYVGYAETHYIVSGFEDMEKEHAEAKAKEEAHAEPSHDQAFMDIPAAARGSRLAVGQADPFCRMACPEGTFCDNHSQSCVPNYVGGQVPSDGYYA